MNLHKRSGTGAPAFTPSKLADHYTDTAAGDAYLSTGVSSSADWKKVSGAGVTFTTHDRILGRVTSGAGPAEEISCTAAARSILDDSSVDLILATLGGTAPTGTGAIARATSPTFVTPTLGVASATRLTIATGTITTSQPVISATQTWNDGGVQFFADLIDITNTASDSASLLIDRRVGGSSKFRVRSDGVLAIAGSQIGSFATDGFYWNSSIGFVLSSGASYTWASGDANVTAQDLFLRRITSGHLGQYNGANAQQFSVYNTWGAAGADFERGVMDWKTTADTLTIGTQKGGTGSNRGINIITGAGTAVAISASGAVDVAGNFTVGNYVGFNGGGTGYIFAAGNGILGLYNSAADDFNRLQFGGATSSFPAIKRRTTALEARLADDSAITTLVGAMVLKAGAVSDTDFTNPVDGCHGYDTTNNKHYVRNGGVWKSSAAYT